MLPAPSLAAGLTHVYTWGQVDWLCHVKLLRHWIPWAQENSTVRLSCQINDIYEYLRTICTHTHSLMTFQSHVLLFFLFAYRWAVPGLTFLWWWASHQVESQGLDLQQCRLRTRQTHRHTAPWDSWWCLRCQVPFMYGSYCGYLMIFGIWHVTVRVFFVRESWQNLPGFDQSLIFLPATWTPVDLCKKRRCRRYDFTDDWSVLGWTFHQKCFALMQKINRIPVDILD